MPEHAKQKNIPNFGEACPTTLVPCHERQSHISTYPLWTWCAAIHALVVLIGLGDFKQLAPRLRIDLPHFAHLGGVVGARMAQWQAERGRGGYWAGVETNIEGVKASSEGAHRSVSQQMAPTAP